MAEDCAEETWRQLSTFLPVSFIWSRRYSNSTNTKQPKCCNDQARPVGPVSKPTHPVLAESNAHIE